jgi:hypothetical protein
MRAASIQKYEYCHECLALSVPARMLKIIEANLLNVFIRLDFYAAEFVK